MTLIAAVGDLISDIVVELTDQYRPGTDTSSTVVRRRGGSAANVAAAACVAGADGRFIGNVGSDDLARTLLDELADVGVDHQVTRSGHTGTVVSIVHPDGERSLLTDRGSSGDLGWMPNGALRGIDAIHIPLYAVMVEPLASTVEAMARAAAEAGTLVSADASSVPVVRHAGPHALFDWCARVGASVLFCNSDEADAMSDATRPGGLVVIEKHGADPAVIHEPDRTETVPAIVVDDVVDTTGAGDAFAAGVLVERAGGADWPDAVRAGHRLAALCVRQLGALTGAETL